MGLRGKRERTCAAARQKRAGLRGGAAKQAVRGGSAEENGSRRPSALRRRSPRTMDRYKNIWYKKNKNEKQCFY